MASVAVVGLTYLTEPTSQVCEISVGEVRHQLVKGTLLNTSRACLLSLGRIGDGLINGIQNGLANWRRSPMTMTVLAR